MYRVLAEKVKWADYMKVNLYSIAHMWEWIFYRFLYFFHKNSTNYKILQNFAILEIKQNVLQIF